MPVEISPDGMIFYINQGIDFCWFCQFIRCAYIPSTQAGETIACVNTYKIYPFIPLQDVALEHPLVSADFELTDFMIAFWPIKFQPDQVLLLLGKRRDSDFCYRLFPVEGIISLKEETGKKYDPEYCCPEKN